MIDLWMTGKVIAHDDNKGVITIDADQRGEGNSCESIFKHCPEEFLAPKEIRDEALRLRLEHEEVYVSYEFVGEYRLVTRVVKDGEQ